MSRLPLLRLLLSPSFLSGVMATGVAAVITAGTAWSYISGNQLFYETLFGIYGFKTLLIRAPDSIWELKNMVLASNVTYYVILALAGVAAGLTTYTVLEGFRRAAHEAAEILEDLRATDQSHKVALHQEMQRLLLRILALSVWGVYSLVFLSALFPYAVVLVRVGVDSISAGMLTGWIHAAAGFGLLAASLHLHAIMLRLFMLRVRLFGSSDIEMARQT